MLGYETMGRGRARRVLLVIVVAVVVRKRSFLETDWGVVAVVVVVVTQHLLLAGRRRRRRRRGELFNLGDELVGGHVRAVSPHHLPVAVHQEPRALKRVHHLLAQPEYFFRDVSSPFCHH